MRQRLGLGIRKLRGKATLQLKFSLSYILVIAAVLILLNSYPLLVSQNMMVASNQNNLKSTAKVIESAMIGLEKLTVENVQAALEGLDESGAARIMVTNSAGLVLYDTRQGSNAVGEYALYSVVAVALRGQDASYCSYDGTAFLSRVATPVVYHNQIVGAVYAYDYDTEQSELLEAFGHNLLIISLLIALLVAGLIGAFYYPTHYTGAIGCQAEIGVAVSMASAALCSMMTDDPDTIHCAASLGGQVLMGLLCNPIGGYVQVPCIVRNMAAVPTAVTCANAALAGMDHIVPLDDVVTLMLAVGEKIRPCDEAGTYILKKEEA